MIRIAGVEDAAQLERLNIAFNGEGETSIEHIRRALAANPQEIVVVDEENGLLVAFLCIQIKRSFCYDDCTPEITELYVEPEFRRRGIARAMLSFAETYCKAHFPCHKIELLTGDENLAAHALYQKVGYHDEGEVHLTKRIRSGG